MLCGVMCRRRFFAFLEINMLKEQRAENRRKEVTYTGLVRTSPYCGVLATENFNERSFDNGSGPKGRRERCFSFQKGIS